MSTPDTDALMKLADDYATKTAKGGAYLGIDGFEAMMPSKASREVLRAALAAQAEAHAAEITRMQAEFDAACLELQGVVERLTADRDALLIALQTADRTFAENGLLACHAARKEIRAAIDAARTGSKT